MTLKFLIIGDLHGEIPNISKSDLEDIHAIIAVGDFCSDALKKYMFRSLRLKLKYSQKQNIDNQNKKTTNKEKHWYDLTGKLKAKKLIFQSLRDGRKVLEHLNTVGQTHGIPIFIVPGNWDWTPDPESGWSFLKKNLWKDLPKGLRNIIDLDYKKLDLLDSDENKYSIIGYGVSSGPEFPPVLLGLKNKQLRKDERKAKKEYQKIYHKLSKFFKKAKKQKIRPIFLSHNVPFYTKLDKIKNKESPRDGQHFGSLIARQIIEEHQPIVCIGGHMHEHFGKCKVRKTTVINAGFGAKKHVFLDVNKNKILRINFHK